MIEGGDANNNGDRERPMDPGRDRLYIASKNKNFYSGGKAL